MLVETTDDRFDAAMSRIEVFDSYEVPKLISSEGARVSTVYAQWGMAETKSNWSVHASTRRVEERVRFMRYGLGFGT